MQVYLLGAILFLAALVTFVFQNPTAVEVRFITWSTPEVSLAMVILITALAGALITFLLDSVRYFRIARTIKELRANNSTLTKQIRELQAHKNGLAKEAEADFEI